MDDALLVYPSSHVEELGDVVTSRRKGERAVLAKEGEDLAVRDEVENEI
jgi:hypothetical protein